MKLRIHGLKLPAALLAAAAMLSVAQCAEPADDSARAAGAARTEYKVRVDETTAETALKALGLDPLRPHKTRRIYFFDTAARDCFAQGIIIRARENGGKSDSTIKVFPAPPLVPEEIYSAKGYKAEFDRTPAGSKLTIALGEDSSVTSINQAIAGNPAKAFSKLQRAMPELLGRKPVPWHKLRVYGPVKSSEWDADCPGTSGISAEYWELNGAYYLGLSIKSGPDKETVRKEIAAFVNHMRALGIRLSPNQTGKTEFVFNSARE